jgi:glutamate decarboxylase
VKRLIVPFIRDADEAASLKVTGNSTETVNGQTKNVLLDQLAPDVLLERFNFSLPKEGRGREGLLDMVQKTLRYSVNTWDQGFLDKLYASTNAVCQGFFLAFPCPHLPSH